MFGGVVGTRQSREPTAVAMNVLDPRHSSAMVSPSPTSKKPRPGKRPTMRNGCLSNSSLGNPLAKLAKAERERLLAEGIKCLREKALQWLRRQNLKIRCDRQDSPSFWVHSILRESRGEVWRQGGTAPRRGKTPEETSWESDSELSRPRGRCADRQTWRFRC